MSKGQRVTNVEIKDRVTWVWSSLDAPGRYTVVTNSFLAGGGDGCTTFKAARGRGRLTDTCITYAQGFIDFVVEDLSGGTPWRHQARRDLTDPTAHLGLSGSRPDMSFGSVLTPWLGA